MFWRYTNCGGCGGLIRAATRDEATEKLRKKYGTKGFNPDTAIWPWTEDDYYDPENPDVFDCYNN